MFGQFIDLGLEFDILLDESLLLILLGENIGEFVVGLIIRKFLLGLLLIVIVRVVELGVFVQWCCWFIVIVVLMRVFQELVLDFKPQICLDVGLEVLVDYLDVELLIVLCH